jgi:hypothetical protein
MLTSLEQAADRTQYITFIDYRHHFGFFSLLQAAWGASLIRKIDSNEALEDERNREKSRMGKREKSKG